MAVIINQMQNIYQHGNRHFVITDGKKKYFQSYESLIVFVNDGKVTIDRYWWENCTKTTAAYRNRFLGETTKEIAAKIKSGEYRLRTLDSRVLCRLHERGKEVTR